MHPRECRLYCRDPEYLNLLPKGLAGGAAEPAISYEPTLLLQLAARCRGQVLLKEARPLLLDPASSSIICDAG